jgi:LPS sulfotransferase NodH
MASAKARLGPLRAYAASARAATGQGRKFVVLTSGRTGSELLVSLLNSHPDIDCDGEILKEPLRWPERLIAGRAVQSSQRGMRAYGFKVQPQHIHDVQHLVDPDDWVRSHRANGWSVIRLRRRNILHQAISVVRRETMPGHHRQGQVSSYEPVALDPMVLIGTMCLITHSEEQISQLVRGADHLDLWYEDALEQPADQITTVAGICRVLGIEPRPVGSDLVRVTPKATRDMVRNYDEIAAEIRRNRFAEFLSD